MPIHQISPSDFFRNMDGNESILLISLMTATLVFIPYWFIYESKKLADKWEDKIGFTANTKFILFTKYAGFILLGIVPFVTAFFTFPADFNLMEQTGLGLGEGGLLPIVIWSLGVGIPILILSYFSAGSPIFQAKYPEIRIFEWSGQNLFKYAAGWFFYLLGYEYLFRGLLFLAIMHATSGVAALAINVSLYAISHIPKGLDEALGAFIIGIVLCLSAADTGTIWPAFIIHIFMAGNFFAIVRNKQMKFVTSKSV
jgi:membrane protease YdiL (CAAX protease family)